MKRVKLSTAVATVAVAVALTSCGGRSSDNPTISGGGADRATCIPSGSQLSISAQNIAYDKSCLAAPAGQELTITFDNKEAVPHNVVISKNGSSNPLYSGDIVTGPKTVNYTVKALPGGTYQFFCAVHPTQMKGTLVVQ